MSRRLFVLSGRWTREHVTSLRHIFITNTLLKQTPWIGPCLSLLSLLDLYDISAQDGHYKSRFKSAGKIWLCQLGVKPAQKLPYKMTY